MMLFFSSPQPQPSSMEIYSTHVFEILKYYDVVDINGNDYDEFVCFEYHLSFFFFFRQEAEKI